MPGEREREGEAGEEGLAAAERLDASLFVGVGVVDDLKVALDRHEAVALAGDPE